ncbi:MAG: GTPase Era [Bacteroidia bacterium]|nr:GTPase Era [Bacteroidia bacterium]
MMHKAGFVNIIGKPNVGKSTLLNVLLGENLAIVNPKAQTTRHRIKGVLNGTDYQIVFSDTPGIMKPAYKLHHKMLDAVNETFTDADVMIYVAEIGETEMDDGLKEKLKTLKVPVFLVLNKMDTINQEQLENALQHWKSVFDFTTIIPISALHKFNTAFIIENIIKHLPFADAYYDKETLTDRNERFFVTEILREKILSLYQKEIPYSTEVAIVYFKDEPNISKIGTVIYVERESQKAIVLGHQGKAIKRLGTEARKSMETFLGRKVFLEITVKVQDGWRDNDAALKKFGYE